MPKLYNRAKMTTATTGAGTITLGSPVSGWQSFAAAGAQNGDSLSYVIEDGAAWEIGAGTYSTTGPTLTRTLVQSSTGALLNLTGSAQVFISALASDIVNNGGANTLGVANGGTGATTKVAAFNALSPMTTLGDLEYFDGTNGVRLAGNTTTTKQFLTQTGTGTVSAAPSWGTVSKSDVGLGNVENTALSTWAGSTAITTLGTISSGTWSGTTIGVSKGGTGLTSLAAGYVPFGNGTSAFGSNSWFAWDNTNARLGIGPSATTPSRQLHLTDAAPYVRIGQDATAAYLDIGRNGTDGYAEYNAAQASPYRGHKWLLGGSEAMRLDASGNLGVGTSSPNNRLAVHGPSVFIRLNDTTSTNDLYIGSDASGGLLNVTAAQSLRFNTSNAERMRITAGGAVGIGTSTPRGFLEIYGTNTFWTLTDAGATTDNKVWDFLAGSGYFSFRLVNDAYSAAGTYYQVGRSGTSTNSHVWYTGATVETMRLNSTGLGIGTTPGYPLHVLRNNPTTSALVTIANTTATGAYGCGLVLIAGSGGSDYSTIGYGADGSLTYAVVKATGYQAWVTNSAERMRIDASGNVSVGSSSPGTYGKFSSVSGSSYVGFQYGTYGTAYFGPRVANDGYGSIYYSWSPTVNADNMWILDYSSGLYGISHKVSGTVSSRFVIDASGNVGIGPSATGKLSVALSGTRSVGAGWDSKSALFGNIGVQQGALGISFNTTYGADIECIAPGVAWYPITMHGAQFAVNTGGIERVRVDASGNVGIGTSSPGSRLSVSISNTSYADALALTNNSTGTGAWTRAGFLNGAGNYAFVGLTNAGEFYFFNTANAAAVFATNNNERMRIDASGNFLVGTTVPNARIYGMSGANAPVGRFDNTLTSGYTSEAFQVVCGQPSGTGFKVAAFYINNAAAYAAYIRGDGVIFAQQTTIQSLSDARLKENIRDASEGLDTVLALKPRRFDWRDGCGSGKKNQLGFIAQEVETVFPDAIDVWDKSDDENDPYKSVGAGLMIPVLVKAIQELAAEVAALKEKING